MIQILTKEKHGKVTVFRELPAARKGLGFAEQKIQFLYAKKDDGQEQP